MKKPFALTVCLFGVIILVAMILCSAVVDSPEHWKPAFLTADFFGIGNNAPATVDEAKLTTEYLSIPQGGSQILSLDEECEEYVTNWKSSNSWIVSVDSGGRADALSEGTAMLTAELSTGQSAKFEVTVTKAAEQPEADKFSTAITANDDILKKNIEEKKEEEAEEEQDYDDYYGEEYGEEYSAEESANTKNLYSINVNRAQSTVTVYTYDKNGNYTVPVRAMICSCGMKKSTITGEFDIYFKAEWHALYNNVYGQYISGISGDYLFHSVPYAKMGNNSTLEIEEFNKLGQEASMGCVRLAVEDTKWIYENCPIGTHVKIYDSNKPEPLGRPEAIRINGKGLGWDPTDRTKGNPYNSKLPSFTGAEDITIEEDSDYSPKQGVKALDTCGSDITDKMQITGKVVTSRPGKYKVTYSVTDALNRSQSVDVWVTVVKSDKEE